MKNNSVTINCLAFQLSMARKKVQRWYEGQLEPLGLSPSYVYVLEVLKEYGPCNLTTISNHLNLERATVSHLLGRMERDAFIERKPGKERRAMEVHLADKGGKILKQALEKLLQADYLLDKQLGGQLDDIKEGILELNQNI